MRYDRSVLAFPFAIALGLCVSGIIVGLSYNLSIDHSRVAVKDVALSALEDSEAIIHTVLTEMQDLTSLSGNGCNNDMQQTMSLQAYLSPVAGAFALIDPQGHITCITGDISISDGSKQVFLPGQETQIRVINPEVPAKSYPSLQIVAPMSLQSPASASDRIVAYVSPEEFRQSFGTAYLKILSHIRLELLDGTAIAVSTADDVPATAQDMSSIEIVSSDLPLRILATPKAHLPWRTFSDHILLIILSALFSGFGAGMLMFRLTNKRLSLQTALDRAVKEGCGDFELHYQPIMDIQTGHCRGVEALIRWHHPVKGLVPPDAFIPLAEKTGLIVPLTRWVIAHALEDMAPYLHNHRDFHLSINLAACHFRDYSLIGDLQKSLACSGIGPNQILLEATERELLADQDETPIQVMDQLSNKGFTIAIDDFGTGHNGLAFLQKFPADIIKIDRTFTKTIGTDAVKRPVLDAIIDLAHRLSMTLIAEGVESDQQAEYLRRKGVHMAQGYHFAKPLAISDLHDFMRDQSRLLRLHNRQDENHADPVQVPHTLRREIEFQH